MVFHDMIKVVKLTKGGNNFQGLGRWASCEMMINSKHRIRVVAVYGISRFKAKGIGTVYRKILRYIQENNLDTNLRKMFEVNFHTALRV